jgi:hypothetical protein
MPSPRKRVSSAATAVNRPSYATAGALTLAT